MHALLPSCHIKINNYRVESSLSRLSASAIKRKKNPNYLYVNTQRYLLSLLRNDFSLVSKNAYLPGRSSTYRHVAATHLRLFNTHRADWWFIVQLRWADLHHSNWWWALHLVWSQVWDGQYRPNPQTQWLAKPPTTISVYPISFTHHDSIRGIIYRISTSVINAGIASTGR